MKSEKNSTWKTNNEPYAVLQRMNALINDTICYPILNPKFGIKKVLLGLEIWFATSFDGIELEDGIFFIFLYFLTFFF